MRVHVISKLRLVIILALLFGQKTYAQIEGAIPQPPISGLPRLIWTDTSDPGTNTVTCAADADITSKKIQNIVTFKIDENSTIYFASGFTATVDFTTECKTYLSSPPSITTHSLTVNYDNTPGSKFTALAYIILPESEEVKVTVNNLTVTGQSGWSPKKVLEVVNEMRITRYYNLSTSTSVLTPLFNTPVNRNDALHVSWGWNAGAHNNMAQLEWAWVEDEMRDYYSSVNEIFKLNSTRVDIDYQKDSFNIPLLYDGDGKLYYRVRPALRSDDGAVITGPWNAPDSFPFVGHEKNLNWQSSTSFAENGKLKSVIQYFDGSLRNRQTVTKDNSTGNTVVSETVYDYQGRKNLEILPTPTIDNTIKYFKDFNRFVGQQLVSGGTTGTYYEDPAKYFDLSLSTATCDGAPKLVNTTGNGKYYSANNDWLLGSESKSKYIPDANGYAYTETRYKDDATERVSTQGGVGQYHQINTGHETKYYYGKPPQQELDALFGNEVGDSSHYSKNMVQDANGQRSISYVDMSGKTIATALAGDPTPAIDSIINQSDYPLIDPNAYITNYLISPETNIIQGNKIEAVNSIIVEANGNYYFTYKLDPAILSLINCSNQQICFDCKYNLEISIKADSCGDAQPIVRRYQNLSIVPSANACSLSMGFSGPGADSLTKEINFTEFLHAGAYNIRKTLTLNDSLWQIRRDSALSVLLCTTQQSIYDSVVNILYASSGCGSPVYNQQQCDSCLTKLGRYSNFRVHYLNSLGYYDLSDFYDPELDNTIRHIYIQDSLECVQACSISTQLSTLSLLRRQMLNDMVPFTGQYAIDSLRDSATHVVIGPIPTTMAQYRFNIFSPTPSSTGIPRPFYLHPRKEAGDTTVYEGDDNLPDPTLYPNGSGDHNYLYTLNKNDFTGMFNRSWTNQLIFYHPEFSKLKFAETTLRSSYEWMDRVLKCDTYQKAVDSGYINPVSHDPYFTGPNHTTGDNGLMSTYLTSHAGTGSSGPSIWQIANAMVLCANLPDADKLTCMNTSTVNGIQTGITLTTEQKDQIWDKFRATYLTYRNEMVVNYINAHEVASLSQASMDSLQAEKKKLYFVNMQDAADQNGMTWWSAATLGNNTAATTYGNSTTVTVDRCVNQRPFWKARLKKCEVLMNWLNAQTTSDSATVNTVINTILDSMVEVCHHSLTPLQIYGASNVNPTYTGLPQNFEEIINNVFHDHGIATLPGNNYFCNPYTIDFPKPFGLNPPLMVNYTNTLDSCACKRFAEIKHEASLAHVDTLRLDSMNVFLWTNYHDSITLPLWQGLARCPSMFHDSCTTHTVDTSLCPDPDITSVVYDMHIERMVISYVPHAMYSNCSIAVYNENRNLVKTITGVDCGASSITDGLDQCGRYLFVMKVSSEYCGDIYSDTVYYDPGCIKPTILAVHINNGNNAWSVSYIPHPCYKSCTLYVYDAAHVLVWNQVIECRDSVKIITTDLNKCTDYFFLIKCDTHSCGEVASDTFHYNGSCPKPVILGVHMLNEGNLIQVNYAQQSCYYGCTIYVYDADNNLIREEGINCTDSVQNLSFEMPCNAMKFVIRSYSEICGPVFSDTFYYPGCCKKPIITAISIKGDKVIVHYGPLPDCKNCTLYVYDQSGRVIVETRLNCRDSVVSINRELIGCNDYAYLIKCSTELCPNNNSDTFYYNNCCPKPKITGFTNLKGKLIIHYVHNISCEGCTLYIYGEEGNRILAQPLNCEDSTVAIDSLTKCGRYAFLIICKSEKCPYSASDTVYYEVNCCPKPVITSIGVDTEGSIVVHYQSQPVYTDCRLQVYDESNSLVREYSINCGYFKFEITDLTDCHNYAFVIRSSSESCTDMYSDTVYYNPCCPKPAILSNTFNSMDVMHVIYLSQPMYTHCQLNVYDSHNHLVLSQTIGCGEGEANISGLDSCNKYNLQIVSSDSICGIVRSDISHYNGCLRSVTHCITLCTPIILPQPVILPPLFNCDYHLPCITCEKLGSLTAEFRVKFPAYSAVPYLDSTITDSQIKENNLWARFLNYRTGFSKNAIDYLKAYRDCQHTPPPTYAICSFTPPLNDPSNFSHSDTTPCHNVETQAMYAAQLIYNLMRDSIIARFDSLYKAKCFTAKYTEQFFVKYQPKEYHFTLYYYDLAGNLVKTMPPAAVKPNYDANYFAMVRYYRANGILYPNARNNYNLATEYRYNTLNQVIAQKTPDAGESKFWYDRLGRLVVSQNAKQLTQNEYSYTLYDQLGRIYEVGQSTNTTGMNQAISQDTTALQSWIANVSAGTKKQITFTVYDVPYTPIRVSESGKTGLFQENLRNRVSYSMVFDDEIQKVSLGDGTYSGGNSATYYSYDIHGNVDTLLQDYNIGMGDIACSSDSANRFKKIQYAYDVISGKVNDVAYQPGFPDQFYHRYSYDAENRITEVKTSKDKIYWEREAKYDYYRHGPLARTILGQNQVQGLDYAYTIQGWLKGVNSTSVGDTLGNGGDIGQDGLNGNPNVARDAFGFSLNYFTDDYKPINTTVSPFVTVPMSLPTDPATGITTGSALFNGNIGAMVVNVPKLGNPMVYGYRYDQLNRIKTMDAFTGLVNATNVFTPVRTNDYHEQVGYDPNGNIKNYTRHGAAVSGNLAMDSLTYHYNVDGYGYLVNNKLEHVTDAVSVHTDDIGTQSSGNYTYDPIGNLTSDAAEGLDSIKWTVYGKIKRIVKSSGVKIDYTYDASGNRISKTITESGIVKNTYYVRDASGNVMSVYQSGDAALNGGDLTQTELHLYGSSRLGIFNVKNDVQCGDPVSESTNFIRGNKFFELSNHLGNVLVTVSDKCIGHDAGNGTADYYTADVVTANDYYPFGMAMPGRKFNNGNYRYGFVGKEMDNEVKGIGNQFDFGNRAYDPRLGRFLSIDPKSSKYPFFTPYNYSYNNPIQFIDGDGEDGMLSGSGTKQDPYIIKATYLYVKGGISQNQLKGLNAAAAIYNNKNKDGNNQAFEIKKEDGSVVHVKFDLTVTELPEGTDVSTDKAMNAIRMKDEYTFNDSKDSKRSFANLVKNENVENFDKSTYDARTTNEDLGVSFFNQIGYYDNTSTAFIEQAKSFMDENGFGGEKFNDIEVLTSIMLHEIFHNLGGEHEDNVSEMKKVGVTWNSKGITSGGDKNSMTLDLSKISKKGEGTLKLIGKADRAPVITEKDTQTGKETRYRQAVLFTTGTKL